MGDIYLAFDWRLPELETAGAPAAEAAATAALEAPLAHDGFVPTLTDFPQRLKRFKEESGLSWAEIARRLGADPKTVRRWHKDGVRPNAHYLLALQDLAKGRASVICSPSERCHTRLRSRGDERSPAKTPEFAPPEPNRTPGGLDIPLEEGLRLSTRRISDAMPRQRTHHR